MRGNERGTQTIFGQTLIVYISHTRTLWGNKHMIAPANKSRNTHLYLQYNLFYVVVCRVISKCLYAILGQE